jgi:hypothetical protein
LLGARHGLLLGVVPRRVLEAKKIVGRTLERDTQGAPVEADLQGRSAVLMRRMLLWRCLVGRNGRRGREQRGEEDSASSHHEFLFCTRLRARVPLD